MNKKLKIPFLKGRWKRIFELTTRSDLLIFFYDIWTANKRKRQQSIELYQAVEHISTSAQSDLTNLVHNVIATTFDPQIQLIQQEMDKKTKNAVQKQKDHNALTQMRNDLLSIV